MHKAKKVLNCSHKMHKLKVMRTNYDVLLAIFFPFSAMEWK